MVVLICINSTKGSHSLSEVESLRLTIKELLENTTVKNSLQYIPRTRNPVQEIFIFNKWLIQKFVYKYSNGQTKLSGTG